MDNALTQTDVILLNEVSRPWGCRDQRQRFLDCRLESDRRWGSRAERQKILTIWAVASPWSAYFAQRRAQPSQFPRSWMGRVLLTLLRRDISRTV